jgi:tryptophan synthase alpha chain
VSGRIAARFAKAGKTGEKVLIPFITAGDPEPGWTVAIMHALVDAGAGLLELGVPFSDPAADGPVIQSAGERAIEKHVDLRKVLTMVEAFRSKDKETPVVLMGYMNPVERFGRTRFPLAAKQAGVDGLLLVDCPPEERGDLGEAMIAAEIDGINLVAPTTTRARVEKIAASASGFIYYVSLKGITGSGQLSSSGLAQPTRQIREFSDLPVAVGFGIQNAEMAASVADHADAVVIGSALVQALSEAKTEDDACAIAQAFVAPVRKALDNTASG